MHAPHLMQFSASLNEGSSCILDLPVVEDHDVELPALRGAGERDVLGEMIET